MSAIATIASLTLFIERNRNEHVFKGWHKNCYEHVNSILVGLVNKHAFVSTDSNGDVDGIGIVTPIEDKPNHFFINQLLCITAHGRRSVIKQFMQTYPKAIVSAAERRGRLKVYNNSDKLLRLITK